MLHEVRLQDKEVALEKLKNASEEAVQKLKVGLDLGVRNPPTVI